MEHDKDLGQSRHFRADNSNKSSAPRGPTKPPAVHPGNGGNYGDYAKEDVTAYAYADDMVIGSKSLKKLQNTIDEVEKWCSQHKFKINT
jgi:Reverse transcriptase (RNA-dependent DNA polymerase).